MKEIKEICRKNTNRSLWKEVRSEGILFESSEICKEKEHLEIKWVEMATAE